PRLLRAKAAQQGFSGRKQRSKVSPGESSAARFLRAKAAQQQQKHAIAECSPSRSGGSRRIAALGLETDRDQGSRTTSVKVTDQAMLDGARAGRLKLAGRPYELPRYTL